VHPSDSEAARNGGFILRINALHCIPIRFHAVAQDPHLLPEHFAANSQSVRIRNYLSRFSPEIPARFLRIAHGASITRNSTDFLSWQSPIHRFGKSPASQGGRFIFRGGLLNVFEPLIVHRMKLVLAALFLALLVFGVLWNRSGGSGPSERE
jgi:hypothetical protein